jgi:hypothetical protein
MRHTSGLIGVVILLLGSSAQADRFSEYVGARDVATYQAAETGLGDYYVIRFEVPDRVKGGGLDHAYLELYLDAASREIDGYVEETPLFEVYALKSDFQGTLTPDQFEAQSVPTVRNVLAGEKRRVVIEITEIVRSHIADPDKNHGLIVGSLTGARVGLFYITSDEFPDGAVARITFFD